MGWLDKVLTSASLRAELARRARTASDTALRRALEAIREEERGPCFGPNGAHVIDQQGRCIFGCRMGGGE